MKAFKFGVDSQPDWFSDMVTENSVITQGSDWASGGGYYSCKFYSTEKGLIARKGDFLIKIFGFILIISNPFKFDRL